MAITKKTCAVLSPAKLSHVVLRTAKFKEMSEYYKIFLGAVVDFENPVACFLRYDEEHHRVGILKLDRLQESGRSAPGLEHVAFTFNSLEDLVTAWEQRKSFGIEPAWCVNHGGTTSMYYEDPDGNKLETLVDNFDDPEELHAFITSASFRENPVGTDFDPTELARRVRSGEDSRTIKKRVEVGPRAFPTSVDAEF